MYHIIYIMTVVYVNLTALSDQLHCIEKCVHQNTVVRDDALRIVTDACVLHQRTTFLSSQNPTCCASLQRSHTVSSMRCHGAWTSAPLSSHPLTQLGKCSISN